MSMGAMEEMNLADKDMVSSKFKTVFRSASDIVTLAYSVLSSGIQLFGNELENPIEYTISDFTPEEEKRFERPQYYMVRSDESLEDKCHRMLSAVEPGTVVPIHRHRASSETVVVIRGKIRWIFYDENGNETERVLLDANGENRMLVVEKDRWHSLESLESGSVLFESKDGAYEPLGEEDILTK